MTRLDRYALVLIGHLHIMDVHVEAPNVNAIQSTFIATTNDEIIDFATLHGVEDQVESRG